MQANCANFILCSRELLLESLSVKSCCFEGNFAVYRLDFACTILNGFIFSFKLRFSCNLLSNYVTLSVI